MRSERGQASVEWVALLLLVALALTVLGRFAPRSDAGDLGPELVHTITCAASGGCKQVGHGTRASAPRVPVPGARRQITVPPLVPLRPRAGGFAGHARPLVRHALPLARRAGRGAGVLWRRSWMLCLGYERVRYAVLHPEIRFPHQGIPLSEDLRIANDCLSPVDLVRDYDLIRGRP